MPRGVASPSGFRPRPSPKVLEASVAENEEAVKVDPEQQNFEHEAKRKAAMLEKRKRLEAEARRKAAEKTEQKHPEDEADLRVAEEEQRQSLEHEARRRAAMRAKRERLEAEARRKAAEEAERKRLEDEAKQKAAEEAERNRLEQEAIEAEALLENLVSRFPHKSRQDVARDLQQKGAHAGTLAQTYRREASKLGL